MIRKCAICGAEFKAPPSSNKHTCCQEHSKIYRSMVHIGVSNQWSEAARERKRASGQNDNLKLGTAAAMRSPIAGRYETNQEAKMWVLIDPTGQQITVRNLMLWARDHTDLFGKPPGEHSARQIASGFRAIAQTLAGKQEKQRPAMTYKGWSLAGLPTIPTDDPSQ